MSTEFAEIERATSEIIPAEELRTRLREAAKTGTRLRIKAGFDPTAKDLHLGHTLRSEERRVGKECRL